MTGKPVAAGKSSFDLIDTKKALAIIDVQPCSTFLDLACGSGKYCIEIAEHAGETVDVYAIDLWKEGLELLYRESITSNLNNIKPIKADIRNALPFTDSSIDCCLMATILHDLSPDDQNAAIMEASRLLKNGGRLNIIEFKKIDHGPGPPLHIRIEEQDIEPLLRRHCMVKVVACDIGKYNYVVQYRKVT